MDEQRISSLVYGDLVKDAMHGRYVRFSRRIDATAVEVLDRNTLEVLPDWTHVAHLDLTPCGK